MKLKDLMKPGSLKTLVASTARGGKIPPGVMKVHLQVADAAFTLRSAANQDNREDVAGVAVASQAMFQASVANVAGVAVAKEEGHSSEQVVRADVAEVSSFFAPGPGKAGEGNEEVGFIPDMATATPATLATEVHGGDVGDNRGNALSEEEEAAIKSWLDSLEEDDPLMIGLLMDRCRTDPEAKAYCVNEARTLLRQAFSTPAIFFSDSVQCGDCCHFQRIDHPHLGRCSEGELQGGACGTWDTDNRSCKSFSRINAKAE